MSAQFTRTGPDGLASANSADGLWIDGGARRIRLKWHMLRRTAKDPPFFRPNLAAGLALGASMEVDIQFLADGAFVCLHDDTLETETDGSGPVAEADSAAIASLKQRDRSGAAVGPAPLMLADLTALLSEYADATAEGAVVQLDLKNTVEAMTDAVVDRFAHMAGPVAPWLSLSGEDWAAVARLGGGVPGLSLGYDPTRRAIGDDRDVGDLAGLIDHVAATAPEAETVYLHHSLIASADARNLDLVGAFHDQNRLVDCWTIGTDRPRTEALLRMAVAAGVDQITTDTPRDLAALWAGMAGRSG